MGSPYAAFGIMLMGEMSSFSAYIEGPRLGTLLLEDIVKRSKGRLLTPECIMPGFIGSRVRAEGIWS